MAKAKFDIKTEATRPIYAGVGVTDLAVARVREYVADVQERFAGVQTLVRDLDFEPKALRDQAVTVMSAQVDALSREAKTRRAAIEARVADLQEDAIALPARLQTVVNENVATAVGTYDDLVKRGETLVARIRRQQSTKATASAAKTTSAKAKTTQTQATKATKSTAKTTTSNAKSTARKTTAAAKKSSTAPRSSAKATTTSAKKTASNAARATSDAASKVGD